MGVDLDQPIIEEDGCVRPEANGEAARTENGSTGVAVKVEEGMKEENGLKVEEMQDEADLERKRQEIEGLLNMPPEMQ
jgi:ribosomal protein S3